MLYFTHWQLLFVYLMACATYLILSLSKFQMKLIQVSGILPGVLRLICGFGGLLLTISHSALEVLSTWVVSFQSV